MIDDGWKQFSTDGELNIKMEEGITPYKKALALIALSEMLLIFVPGWKAKVVRRVLKVVFKFL